MKAVYLLPSLSLLLPGALTFVPTHTSKPPTTVVNGASLVEYALEKVIDTSVPTLGAIAVILVASKVGNSIILRVLRNVSQ